MKLSIADIYEAREELEPELPVSFYYPSETTEYELVRGVVNRCYNRVFTLKDGRSFTYLDYILGTKYYGKGEVNDSDHS